MVDLCTHIFHMGPGAQYLSTWELSGRKCSTGFGEVYSYWEFGHLRIRSAAPPFRWRQSRNDARTVYGLGIRVYSPPHVDRIWGIWGSYYNKPQAIFYLLKGDYRLLGLAGSLSTVFPNALTSQKRAVRKRTLRDPEAQNSVRAIEPDHRKLSQNLNLKP